MTILPVGSECLRDILAIENASFSDPWSEESFREAFRSDLTTVYGVFDDAGMLCGYACLCVIDEEAELYNIASAPECRRQGVGQALLRRVLSDCEARGVRSIYLEVRASNAAALGLYEKVGFMRLGVRRRYYSDPTEDAVIMKKSIRKEP